MNQPCGCYYGGDCTKTTACAVLERLEETVKRMKSYGGEVFDFALAIEAALKEARDDV